MPLASLSPLRRQSLAPLTSSADPPYVLSITPTPSAHLLLTHPSPVISLLNGETLQRIHLLGEGETNSQDTSAVCCGDVGAGVIWSAGKDGIVRRWDEKTGESAGQAQARVRQNLPLLSLAALPSDNLLAAGTELVGSDAYVVYWDPRNMAKQLYTHSQTHSDDITSLTFLPPTSTLRLPPSDTHLSPGPLTDDTPSAPAPLPARFLLSSSTDGTLALSDPREADEDEAQWAAEGLEGGVGGSVAGAGWWEAGFNAGGGVGLWARSDMDGFGSWRVAKGEEGVEMVHPKSYEPALFRPLLVDPSGNITREEQDPFSEPPASAFDEDDGQDAVPVSPRKDGSIAIDFMVDVCPGMSGNGAEPGVLVGSNCGDIVLMHHDSSSGPTGYTPSAFLRSGGNGHKDVVRCLYHDPTRNILYTGSEDAIVCAWRMPESAGPAGPAADVARDEDPGEDGEDPSPRKKKSKRKVGEVLGGKKTKKRREEA